MRVNRCNADQIQGSIGMSIQDFFFFVFPSSFFFFELQMSPPSFGQNKTRATYTIVAGVLVVSFHSLSPSLFSSLSRALFPLSLSYIDFFSSMFFSTSIHSKYVYMSMVRYILDVCIYKKEGRKKMKFFFFYSMKSC